MRQALRSIALGAAGVVAIAAVVAIWGRTTGSRERGKGSSETLYVAALDDAVGQPARLLGANLPRLRLRFGLRHRGSGSRDR